jgi:hypothetical protein
MPIKEAWNSRVEPRFSTAEFPSWEVTPAGAWNYGIAVDPAKLDGEVEIKIEPGPVKDPWDNPPIVLTVPLRKIEGWELLSNPENPAQKFTPALPDLSKSKISDTVERVALVPYGSTHLRVTIFPALKG